METFELNSWIVAKHDIVKNNKLLFKQNSKVCVNMSLITVIGEPSDLDWIQMPNITTNYYWCKRKNDIDWNIYHYDSYKNEFKYMYDTESLKFSDFEEIDIKP